MLLLGNATSKFEALPNDRTWTAMRKLGFLRVLYVCAMIMNPYQRNDIIPSYRFRRCVIGNPPFYLAGLHREGATYLCCGVAGGCQDYKDSLINPVSETHQTHRAEMRLVFLNSLDALYWP